jgi:hypothetical protein
LEVLIHSNQSTLKVLALNPQHRYGGTIDIGIVSWLCRMCALQDLPPTLPKQAPEPVKPSDSGKAGVAGRRGSKSTTARRGSGTSAGSFDGGRLLEPISKVSGAKPHINHRLTKGVLTTALA